MSINTPRKERRNKQRSNGHQARNENALRGLVVSRAGKEFIVEAIDGSSDRQRYRCRAKNHLDLLVGDRVLWEPTQHGNGWIASCEPRDTLIERFTHGHSTKRMAANVTAMVIMIAPKPAPSKRLLNQYLVASCVFGCTPIITLNKADMASPGDPADRLMEHYAALAYTCLRISAKQHQGLNALADLLAQHTAILMGQSGVGKSSLIKAWLPDEPIVVGALSESNALGRHTTSNSTLYHLPAGHLNHF